ncbi:hypothetical protein UFOVP620_52 [uncultured Caudovirales phage]|jgi:hypothetical protein|uniref:Uncharacterized protein n=1 Tax=uncultured Caudovirales phage TaxID=2100421 RepID=A0A6J5N366_9CAUD|nr:hypothetical protein UFOVP620_52 [uncultured Caudovirales phage]
MPTIISDNVLEWKLREMARKSGKKYEPEPTNPYAKLNEDELKHQQSLINEVLEQSKLKEIDN